MKKIIYYFVITLLFSCRNEKECAPNFFSEYKSLGNLKSGKPILNISPCYDSVLNICGYAYENHGAVGFTDENETGYLWSGFLYEKDNSIIFVKKYDDTEKVSLRLFNFNMNKGDSLNVLIKDSIGKATSYDYAKVYLLNKFFDESGKDTIYEFSIRDVLISSDNDSRMNFNYYVGKKVGITGIYYSFFGFMSHYPGIRNEYYYHDKYGKDYFQQTNRDIYSIPDSLYNWK